MYHHWLKQRALQGRCAEMGLGLGLGLALQGRCAEMGGFTLTLTLTSTLALALALALSRCGDMGGFTRLCATKGGQPDGLEGEIPSIFVPQLPDEVTSLHLPYTSPV